MAISIRATAIAALALVGLLAALPASAVTVAFPSSDEPASPRSFSQSALLPGPPNATGYLFSESQPRHRVQQSYSVPGLTQVSSLGFRLSIADNTLMPNRSLTFQAQLNGVPVANFTINTGAFDDIVVATSSFAPIDGFGPTGDRYQFRISVIDGVAANMGAVAFNLVTEGSGTLDLRGPGSDIGIIPLPASAVLLLGATGSL
ncbi:MAG: hypothetical protein AAF565_00975, partial [Pseudomonadota bacterium]